MLGDFQQTVNLRETEEFKKNEQEQFDRVYNGNKKEVKKELQRIDRPKIKQVNEKLARRIIIFLAIILIGSIFYFMFFNKPACEIAWYMVELVDGEVYYGKIDNLSVDPIIIQSVYYNYNQIDDDENEIDETDNIRLVKRGQETHGPSGVMYVYQVQIKKIDKLREDSQVLKAISEYEK